MQQYTRIYANIWHRQRLYLTTTVPKPTYYLSTRLNSMPTAWCGKLKHLAFASMDKCATYAAHCLNTTTNVHWSAPMWLCNYAPRLVFAVNPHIFMFVHEPIGERVHWDVYENYQNLAHQYHKTFTIHPHQRLALDHMACLDLIRKIKTKQPWTYHVSRNVNNITTATKCTTTINKHLIFILNYRVVFFLLITSNAKQQQQQQYQHC